MTKKFGSSLILLLAFFAGYSQKNNVQSAANSFKEKEYADAKKFIDLALEHPSTSNDPKMWYYRGRVYLSIHQADSSKLDPDAIEKSTKGLINCLNTDENKMFPDSAKYYLMSAAIMAFYEGANQYKLGNYPKASKLYNLVLSAFQYDDKKDLPRNNVSEKTVYLYMYYAANSANDKANSKLYLNKLIEMNYNDPKIYIAMSSLLLEDNDTAGALSCIEKGRERFYDDKDLIREQVGLAMKIGKSDELLNRLNKDIDYDPGNGILYVVRGILYEKKNNTDSAVADYTKALELNPASFIANYNLGIIYFNEGGRIMNEAKDILDNKVYSMEKNKADTQFKKAIPYFEAALEINPKDELTLQGLMRLYVRVGEDEKYQMIKKQIEGK